MAHRNLGRRIIMSEHASELLTTKREFLKKAAYMAPAVLTLAAAPSFASAGSSSHGRKPKKPKKNYGKLRYRKGSHKSKDD
jgi:hypothetical protein